MVKIISLLLVFCLVFACPLQVSAASVPERDVVNLLSAFEYTYFAANYLGNLSRSSTPYSSPFVTTPSSSRKHAFSWNVSPGCSLSEIHITVASQKMPSTVYISNSSNGSNPVEMILTFAGSDTSGVNLYTFSITSASMPTITTDIFFIFEFSSLYSGVLGIESCLGWVDNIYIPTYYEYSFNRVYEGEEVTGGASQGLFWENIDSGFTNSIYDLWINQEFWWAEGMYNDPPSRLDVEYIISLQDYSVLDRVVLVFSCSGGLIGDPGVALISRIDKVPVANPSFTWSFSTHEFYLDSHYGSFDIYQYVVEIDLSGLDLNSTDLRLSFSAPYLVSSTTEELSCVYSNLNMASVYVPVEDRTIWMGIANFFRSLYNGIVSILNVIVEWLGDIFNMVQDHLVEIEDWLEGIFNNLSASEEDEEDAEQFEQEANQSNQDLNDLSGKMDAVDRPPIDDINISVDSYIPADGVSVLTSPFNIVFGNNYIFKILSVSMIMALVSYVLFGKR